MYILDYVNVFICIGEKNKSGNESDGDEGVGIKRGKKAILSDSDDDDIVPRKKKKDDSRQDSGSELSESESDGEGGRKKKKKKRIAQVMSESEDEVGLNFYHLRLFIASTGFLMYSFTL